MPVPSRGNRLSLSFSASSACRPGPARHCHGAPLSARCALASSCALILAWSAALCASCSCNRAICSPNAVTPRGRHPPPGSRAVVDVRPRASSLYSGFIALDQLVGNGILQHEFPARGQATVSKASTTMIFFVTLEPSAVRCGTFIGRCRYTRQTGLRATDGDRAAVNDLFFA